MTDVRGLPLLVANGKSVMMYTTVVNNGGVKYDIQIREFGSTDTKSAPMLNENGVMSNIRSVSADNENVAYSFIEGLNNPNVFPAGGMFPTQIVVSNFKKNSAKSIYKTKDGETIQDFDWR